MTAALFAIGVAAGLGIGIVGTLTIAMRRLKP